MGNYLKIIFLFANSYLPTKKCQRLMEATANKQLK